MGRLRAVKASEWLTFSTAAREVLRTAGGVAVNDVFYPLWRNDNPINLLYGGYGSGKSVFVCLELLRCCIESPYFRCCYGRKVLEDVRGSVHATLCDVIEDFGLAHFFKYSRQPQGSLVIQCVNGNSFFPFGAGDAKSLKSIKDPTHFFCEELDQFDEADFQLIYPRLRTTKAPTQFYGVFNTEAVHEQHWLRRLFFTSADFGVPVCRTFANYTDNYFIDRDAYYAKLKLAAAGNPHLLNAIARGEWAVTENKAPWLYNFDAARHVRPLKWLPQFPVYLSFDFNNDPFACVAMQYSPDMGGRNSFIHYLREFSGMMKVEEMCARIRQTFPNSILFITGDRSGQNEDLGRNRTLYEMIAAQLQLSHKQLHLNTHNLEHADSRLLCNGMLAHYPNMYIDGEHCPNLIHQMHHARIDDRPTKAGLLLKDRALHKNDELDAWRYSLQTYFLDWVRRVWWV